jgi:hypothetical protein
MVSEPVNSMKCIVGIECYRCVTACSSLLPLSVQLRSCRKRLIATGRCVERPVDGRDRVLYGNGEESAGGKAPVLTVGIFGGRRDR